MRCGDVAIPGNDGNVDGYGWIPIVGPMIGGLIGAFVYDGVVGRGLSGRAGCPGAAARTAWGGRSALGAEADLGADEQLVVRALGRTLAAEHRPEPAAQEPRRDRDDRRVGQRDRRA